MISVKMPTTIQHYGTFRFISAINILIDSFTFFSLLLVGCFNAWALAFLSLSSSRRVSCEYIKRDSTISIKTMNRFLIIIFFPVSIRKCHRFMAAWWKQWRLISGDRWALIFLIHWKSCTIRLVHFFLSVHWQSSSACNRSVFELRS